MSRSGRGCSRDPTGASVGPAEAADAARAHRAVVPLLALAALLLAGCGGVDEARTGPEGVVATAEDWRIVAEKVRWARSLGLDTLPVGESVARIGLSFVGTPYVPKTLEIEGPERTVVNLRGLDCVTFVETVLALDRVVRDSGVDPGRRDALARAYADALTRIRYRGGERRGYASRLHYFSEWIRDGEGKGVVREVTAELGGVPDSTALGFMSGHPEAYRQLADPEVRDRIREVEARLSRTPRSYLPEEGLVRASDGIRTGDVIAATSTVAGLDVAHTGIALRRNGALHLLHAPLVGDSVQVSERPIPERIAALEGQDGIMVARPRAPASRDERVNSN